MKKIKYIYKNIKKTIDNDKNNNFIIVNTLCKEILKEEIYELLYYITTEQAFIKLCEGEYYGKIYSTEELNSKINKLYEEYEDGITHYSRSLIRSIKFLED